MDSVTICNLALNMLGIPPIINFDDDNNNAKLCKQFYPVMRDRVLRDHNWSFATKALILPLNTKKPFDPEYEYMFTLPGEVIRISGIIPDIPYRKVGNCIFANEPKITLVYVARIEDPEMFDQTFVEALQYLIAKEIGLANTRDGNLIAYFQQEYDRKLAVARSIDTQENPYAHQPNPGTGSFIAARRGANTGYNRSQKVVFVKGNAGIQG